ncbi:MAG: D-alanine--D-alanine ligase [Bacteroidia bacterium]|nr:D-alanine--D-alanine ligase [Bacteroidota bacterium]MCZ2128927.1 D-alanine--D-alanine ligase [Bacteroidia bacterium]
MDKIRVGIFFGGRSREREVSFAGGRTVYDNLDKTLFDAIPVFVDSFNQFIVLEWNYIYKGTIRDFYPPTEFLPALPEKIQIYAESLDMTDSDKARMAAKIGRIIQPQDFKKEFDFAFLALHGSYGEDGSIQGLLEWYDIPYSGSGVFGTALGMNKRLQKQLAPHDKGFNMLQCQSIDKNNWFGRDFNRQLFYQKIKNEIAFPIVVKSANQGSSIGVSFVKEDNFKDFEQKVNRSFFCEYIESKQWRTYSEEQKLNFVRELIDLRSGIGLPVVVEGNIIRHPQILLDTIAKLADIQEWVELYAYEHDTEVLFEPFIKGREFSCIVLRQEDGTVRALPPTEIVKRQDFFDYRSKYLPGLSRKITPMNVESAVLSAIRNSCQHLMNFFEFKVYARIDGFLTEDNTIYLNDPNTTSGMMPSSFFFHQAAEIGLSPSEFLTYIIRTSLTERARSRGVSYEIDNLLAVLEQKIGAVRYKQGEQERLAVILGGNSFERHISVESGRNVFEKISSSGKYNVVPVFLDYTHHVMRFFKLPISMLLKDNADDIRDKVMNFKDNHVLNSIRSEFDSITQKYVKGQIIFKPEEIKLEQLPSLFEGVFLALHGRPGEDGTIQKELDRLGIYYNGSGWQSSSTTIDKYATIQVLKEAGFPVTAQKMVYKSDWIVNPDSVLDSIESNLVYPLILKPHDDGCSSAVIKIKNRESVRSFANLIFRKDDTEGKSDRTMLGVGECDEFPIKESFLVESFIDSAGAEHFLEITGGMLTKFSDTGAVEYLVFEPSEALAEGEILSLEEKFLAGQGQNITPARYSPDKAKQIEISKQVKEQLLRVAKVLNIEGYCRIDAFVRIFAGPKVEVIVIEVNSLPGMTPATCIYHQAALENLKPFEFIDSILKFGKQRTALKTNEERV